MKLNYEIEIEDKISEIEGIHNYLDMVFIRENLNIKKSTLQSDGELAEITIHDSKRKCRVCGCDWFHACPGGCYWVEDDLCSCCSEELQEEKSDIKSENNCANCRYGLDIECATKYECELTGEVHYCEDTCFEFSE